MCDYCNGENKRLNQSGDMLELYLNENRFSGWTIDDNYSGESSKPIKFCPMCGRKLDESEE